MDNKAYQNVSCIEFICDSETYKITEVNKDFEDYTGYTAEYINKKGLRVSDLFIKEYYDEYCPIIRSNLDAHGKVSSVMKPLTVFDDNNCKQYFVYCNYSEGRKDRIHVRAIEMTSYLQSTADDEKRLIGEIESNKAAINKLTTIDSLTNIYNYKSFSNKLKEFLSARRNKGTVAAVVYSDIDNFSYINAYFGTELADHLLTDFARILKNCENIVLCGRVYCDFFVYVIEGKSKNGVLSIVDEIYDRFKKYTKEMYHNSDIYTSSGVYFLTESDNVPQIVVDNANLARRHSKGNKQEVYSIYKASLRAERIREQEIATNIHMAIRNGEIEAFLQPKFSLSKRKIIGAEALVRWRNPDGTYRPPFEFIGVLEQIGYIVDLDWEVYRQTLVTLSRWLDKGYDVVPVSVNFSRLHSDYPDFGRRIIEMADEYNVPHNLIEIEITESAIARQHNIMLDNLADLRKNNFIIDMDDFGTGYSSLSFLVNAPIDIVKVDKVFVDQITSKKSQEYVKHLCDLISITGKDVIFEGVETESQVEFCKKCGFDKGQGWIFDKAIPIDEFEEKYMKKTKTA